MHEFGNPLVSIICPTYNHESYIRECLEGFVSQITSFDIEIIVHDDASTDKTVDIIKEYESKYPHLFKNVYQTENQFSKDISSVSRIMFAKAKGKYIALCEGDDYWIDSFKLQKQIDFLENNLNFSLCFTNFETLKNSNYTFNSKRTELNRVYKISDLIINNPFATSTAVFRSKYTKITPDFFNSLPILDLAFYLQILKQSKSYAFVLADVTSVYRIHEGGIHGKAHLSNKHMIEAFKHRIQFWTIGLKNDFLPEYKNEIRFKIISDKKILSHHLFLEKKYFEYLFLKINIFLFKLIYCS